MGHSIQVIIGSKEALEAIHKELGGSKVIELAQNLALLPVTDELYDVIPDADSDVLSEKGFVFLSAKMKEFLLKNSANNSLAYVETEYFGGLGGQGSMLFRGGNMVFGPQTEGKPINAALRLMGVKADAPLDEFDAIGLGRFRSNEDWINQPNFERGS